jgi:hypothetical protein
MSQSMFTAQVDLLLRILPYVMRDRRFALKGGSALNLFVRDLIQHIFFISPLQYFQEINSTFCFATS